MLAGAAHGVVRNAFARNVKLARNPTRLKVWVAQRAMDAMNGLLGIIQLLNWPYQAISDAIELRQLRREFPNAHRHLVATPHGAMPEPDASYLDRLRDFHWDREAEANARFHPDQSGKATLCEYWQRRQKAA